MFFQISIQPLLSPPPKLYLLPPLAPLCHHCPLRRRRRRLSAVTGLSEGCLRARPCLRCRWSQVGIVSKAEAILMAENVELDLVILSPDADPPVVRIMDYKKYKYEQQRKKKMQQKKSSANRMDLKELKMGYNIDSHDYAVRLKAAQKFLKDGDKVKVIVNLKGRENEFRNKAIELIKRFQNEIGELATEESKNFSERNIFIVLVPNKAIERKSQDQPKKKEKQAIEISAGV